MDMIWGWVNKLQEELDEAGQNQAAQLIDKLSDDVAELNIGKVEAAMPEALALSRSLQNPWLEVYFRHWEMRNRVGSLVQGEVALKDAVEFFEFAHREETMECPQSICVTQDLAECYANMDGPGWVEERLAVAEETLERISPKWNCFQCLSCEYAEALIDDQRYHEALGYLDQQEQKILAAGEELFGSLSSRKVMAYVKLGEYEKAYELFLQNIKNSEKNYQWRKHVEMDSVNRAHLLALLGKIEESREALPAWSSISPMSYQTWIAAAVTIAKKDAEFNTWSLSSIIQQALNYYDSVGTYRRIIDMSMDQIDLALARGSVWCANQALKMMQTTLPKLRKQDGIQAIIDQYAEKIATFGQAELPVPANELLAWLNAQEDRDPEKEIDWLQLAAKALPEDQEVLSSLIDALKALNADQEAMEYLWAFVEKDRTDSQLAYTLLSLLINGQKTAELDRFIALFEPESAIALWSKIQRALNEKNLDQAKTLSFKMYELYPDYRGPISVLVYVFVEQKDFANAAKWKCTLANMEEDPRNQLWDVMSYLCAAENWDEARNVAAELEINLVSESGVIEEDWGLVYIRTFTEDGPYDALAQCNGPVTARILEPSAPSMKEQLCNDWVVFDAEHLVERPEDENERFIPVFRKLHTLEKGNFGTSWLVDGAFPGDELFDQFKAQLDEKGWRIWVRSPEDYTVTDSENNDASLAGIYFVLTAPQNISAKEIDQAMHDLTKAWDHSMVWYYLAKEAGKAVEPHLALIERYQLD